MQSGKNKIAFKSLKVNDSLGFIKFSVPKEAHVDQHQKQKCISLNLKLIDFS